jgi:hypothetical protein
MRVVEQGAQLTIFCAAPGAGSSLYFRGLSWACDCDIVIITALGAAEQAGCEGVRARATRVQLGCSDAAGMQ